MTLRGLRHQQQSPPLILLPDICNVKHDLPGGFQNDVASPRCKSPPNLSDVMRLREDDQIRSLIAWPRGRRGAPDHPK